VNFSDFYPAIHILRANCAETVQDKLRQPAYGMFGIKRRFQRRKAGHPRFNESSIRVHQLWAPPWKRAISATVD